MLKRIEERLPQLWPAQMAWLDVALWIPVAMFLYETRLAESLLDLVKRMFQ